MKIINSALTTAETLSLMKETLYLNAQKKYLNAQKKR